MKITTIIFLFLSMTNSLATPTAVFPEITQTFHNVRDMTIYENEAYFSAQSTMGDLSVIVRTEKVNGTWINPSVATFSGNHHDIEPFISSNGLKLYFASKRPKKNNPQSTDYDIWYVYRNNIKSNWSKPINMGSVINTDKNEFYPSLADNGNLYFTANYEDSKGKDDIYFSEFKNNKYSKPYSLSSAINTSGDEYNAYIARDETYLIFGAYKREGGFGSGDLYISYKQNDYNWSPAQNMGKEVNSKQMDYCPFVITNKLYFTSRRSEFNTIKFNNINELVNTYNSNKNGMSRIYQVDLELIQK